MLVYNRGEPCLKEKDYAECLLSNLHQKWRRPRQKWRRRRQSDSLFYLFLVKSVILPLGTVGTREEKDTAME